MTRTILGIATALLLATTLSAPSAQACISCEYTPEVVSKGAKSHEAKAYAKKRIVIPSTQLSARPSKARIAKAAPSLKPVVTAKTSETSKTVAAEAQPASETISTAATSDAEATPAAKPVEETKVAQDVGCKKFVSAIGTTITVPCE